MVFPKISIITPSFNQGRYLEQSILSVLEQNYPNLEYIIIDGGSTDQSVEIIKKYEKHLHYWISEKDRGQSEAINKGFKKATGEIITWLNSDDRYEKGTLRTVAENFAKQKDLSILHGKTILFGDSVKERTVGLDKDIPVIEYLPSMKIAQPSSFFSKAVFDVITPVNEQLHYAMDFELIVKTVLLGHRIKRLDAVLSHYRLHKDSKSMDEMKFLPEWSQVVYNFFCSVKKGKIYSETFEKLEITDLQRSTLYKVARAFTQEELETIFLQHLHLHYHYNYRFLNYKHAHKIGRYLKINHLGFYKQMHLNKYDLRLKIIPKFIFSLIRRYRR